MKFPNRSTNDTVCKNLFIAIAFYCAIHGDYAKAIFIMILALICAVDAIRHEAKESIKQISDDSEIKVKQNITETDDDNRK